MGNLILGSLLVIVGVAMGLFTKKPMQKETEFNFGSSLRTLFSQLWWQLFTTLGLIQLSHCCVDFSTMTWRGWILLFFAVSALDGLIGYVVSLVKKAR